MTARPAAARQHTHAARNTHTRSLGRATLTGFRIHRHCPRLLASSLPFIGITNGRSVKKLSHHILGLGVTVGQLKSWVAQQYYKAHYPKDVNVKLALGEQFLEDDQKRLQDCGVEPESVLNMQGGYK